MTKGSFYRSLKRESIWAPLNIVFALSVFNFLSCSTKTPNSNTQILLNLESAEIPVTGKNIYLVELNQLGGNVIDTFEIAGDGKFVSHLRVPKKGLYRVNFPSQHWIYLILDTIPAHIVISGRDSAWEVENSYESSRLQQVFNLIDEGQNAWNVVMKAYSVKTMEAKVTEFPIDSVEALYRNKLIDFVLSDTEALSSLYALHYLPKKTQDYRMLADSILNVQSRIHKDNYLLIEIKREFDL